MEVIVSGYNKTIDNLSPEIISATYARISRDPRSIQEIREEAKKNVEKARNSNKNIVFGLGHSSIAEHVIFNIDIIGVSRFLVEEIESHRLTSYTEKSQRYVLFDNDYVIPDDISDKKQLIKFKEIINEQFEFYKYSYPILLEYFKTKFSKKYKEEPRTVEGWAKEDARYAISLATKTQLGMTISARNLELMIRRLRACPYSEAVELSQKLYNSVYSIAPSLFPYISPSKLEYKIKNKKNLDYYEYNYERVELISPFENMYTRDETLSTMFEIGNTTKEKILNSLYEMEVFDSAPREFERVDFEYIVDVSASCYAQLKRHRMMTLIPYPYTKKYIIPKSIIESGLEDKFKEVIDKTNSLFKLMGDLYPYIVTNSHIRKCYLKINLREMYHFCRMRMDSHAQWEIKDIVKLMAEQATEVCPIGMSLCCGKDKFEETYKKIFEE